MLLFGHRGARGEAPENTLPGFDHAIAAGAVAVELDVRLAVDGQLVVVHDATVDRTTTAAGPVSAYSAAALATLDARAAFPDWPAAAGIPRLTAVLDRCAGRVRLAIELKTDTPPRLEAVCATLIALLRARGVTRRVTLTSFDPVALEIAARLAPAIPRAYIGAFDTPAFLETALRLGCRQADIPLARGSAEAVRRAQAAGLRVVGWQGNTEADLEALLAWGVDGITSDYPSRALAALHARGISTADDWD
jgi:glycerophosphoryl diester phosphodiesterase